MESGGRGDIVEPPARATPIDDSSWTDFWYLPGPIIENTLPAPVIQPLVVAPTAPPDYLKLIYEQLLGRSFEAALHVALDSSCPR
jgi:hypothetical protein